MLLKAFKGTNIKEVSDFFIKLGSIEKLETCSALRAEFEEA